MYQIKRVWKHLWPHIKKYQWTFYLTYLFFSIRVVFSSVLQPFYFKKIIDALGGTPGSDVMHLVIIMIAVFFFGALFARFGSYTMVYCQNNILRELRDYSFFKLKNHSYSFFASKFTGSLVTKAKRFVNSFEQMHDIIVFNFTTVISVFIGIFYVLFSEAPFIAVVFLAWAFVYVLIVALFIRKKIKYDLLEAEADSRVGGQLADAFGNIVAIKIFSAGDHEYKLFQNVTTDEAQKRGKAWHFANMQEVVQASLMFFIQAFVLYFMIHLWQKGSISTGTVVLIQTYTIIIFDRLWDLGKSLTKFMKSTADMREVIDIFDIVPDILDPIHPEVSRISKGEIVFDKMHFEYFKGQNVFKDFNLEIKSGQKVGMVGHSGSGKTTITKLLLRFTDVTSGAILIDGQDIRNITQDDLRRSVSYVPQEPVLFHRTIRDNIAYGKPNATDEEIAGAAKKAHAHIFISKLKHGYDTFVGERGVKLSGGERQRIAIARAMLKDAPILILDEATSSLDSVSETYIKEALEILMQGKTVIVIAHRLSTVNKMDRIIVLANGAIVEDGTHKQLLRKKGTYAELWDHQSGGFIE